MNRDRILTLALALVCLFVVASAAGSLESAVDSSPSEAIDLDYASLPIDKGQASDIKREYQSLTDDSQAKPEETNTGSDTRADQMSGGVDDGNQDSTSSSSTNTEQSTGPGSGTSEDVFDKLLEALLSILSSLIRFLVVSIVFVGLAVAVWYREEFTSRLEPIFDRDDSPKDDVFDGVGGQSPATPQNEVTEAWYEMVQRLQLDGERPLTPRERAALARRDGADANSIWSLTELFEEVKYGGAPVTEQRRQRASQYLDRLRQSDGGNEP